MATAAYPATLSDLSTFDPADVALVDILIGAGQEHLFANWRPGADAEKKRAFFESVRALEANYPGGVTAYAKNARELLRSSAAGENPFAGMRPEVPDLVRHDYATPGFVAAEERGMLLVRDSAFVLVAGGLGERLGYTDIKVSLPVQSVTEQCYLDLYVSQLLAMQTKSNAAAGGAPVTIPLVIMTSDDTQSRTVVRPLPTLRARVRSALKWPRRVSFLTRQHRPSPPPPPAYRHFSRRIIISVPRLAK